MSPDDTQRPGPLPATQLRYRAFISYSHVDRHAAAWFHRALEAYVVPRPLVGSMGRLGEVPARLYPVFRDREELSTTADLPARLDEALSQSQALVVVCSPAAAASRWVDLEVRRFVELHDRERVFCVIVAGGSSAADARECLPAPLRAAPDQDALTAMPLAADARPEADGRDAALLKLVAGLLGLDLDRLRQRDLQRRRQRNRLWAAAALSVMTLLAAAAWYANLRRIDAELASTRAEKAVVAERAALDAEREARWLAETRERETAEARDAEAEQRRRAEAQRRVAERERGIAVEQRKLADLRQQVALARQLAAQADRIRIEQPGELTLAALLAIEAGARLQSLETHQALQGVLRVLPQLPRSPLNERGVKRARFAPDGQVLLISHSLLRTESAPGGRNMVRTTGERLVALKADGTRTLWTSDEATSFEWAITPDGCCVLSQSARDGWRLRALDDGGDITPAPAYLQALRGVGAGYPGSMHFNRAGDLFAVSGRVLRVPGGELVAPAAQLSAVSERGGWIALASKSALEVLGHEGRLVARFGVGRERRPVLSPDGTLLLALGHQQAEVFDVRAGQRLFERNCDVPFVGAAFTPDGTRLAISCGTELLLLDARSGAITASLHHDRPIQSLQFASGGTQLLTGSYDRTARVWDLASARELWRATHADYVSEAHLAPDGSRVATIAQGALQLWPLDPVQDRLASLPRAISTMAFSRDGRRAAAMTYEPVAELFVIDSATGRVQSIDRTTQRAEALDFSPDGQHLLAADQQGVRVYRLSDAPSRVWSWTVGGGSLAALRASAFAPNGDVLIVTVSAGLDGSSRTLRCQWRGKADGNACRSQAGPERPGGRTQAWFGQGGSLLVFGTSDSPAMTLLAFDTEAEGARPTILSPPWRVNAVASMAGLHFVAHTAGRLIERAQATGASGLRIAHEGWVSDLALSPDGRFLAGGMHDPVSPGKNRVVVWRTGDGQEVARFDRPGQQGPIRFSPDGRHLVYVDGPHLRRVLWQMEDVAAQACGRLSRNLGCEEWHRWVGDEPYRPTCPSLQPLCPAPAR